MYDSTTTTTTTATTGFSSPLPCPDDISAFVHHLLHPSSNPSSSSLFSPNPHFKSLLDQSPRLFDSPSTDDSPSFLLPADFPHHHHHLRDSGDCEAVAVSANRRKGPTAAVENDFEDDCESEEGLEGSEGPSKSAPSRSSSKRSRAAEVHNLSEKRRRSRINEKMKALQNLIPNSNKTDKASMLDEAIEYLKQLQLQVQMLSMRNGFSLHPMYLPGVIQSPQLPQIQMGFSEGNGLPHMSLGHDTLPVNPESSNQTSFGLSNQSTTSNQPMVIPSMTNITPSDTQYGLETPLQGHQGSSFQLPATSEEIYREQMLRQQQYYVSQSPRNTGDNKMKIMAATSLPFDARSSALEHTNCAEASVLHRERSQRMLPKDVDNNQTFIQHLHSLQTGLNLPTDAPTR